MWPYPKVLAHRGAGTLAPENTLSAIRRGWALGFRAIEVDAMLAADDVPVLIHDPLFGRTLPGKGAVARTPAATLMTMDAGSWFSPEFAGEPVPSLAAAIAFCRAHGIWMNIEIKPSPGVEARTGDAVARCVLQAFAAELQADAPDSVRTAVPLLSSFSRIALSAAKDTAPAIPRGLLVDRPAEDWLQALLHTGAVALHVNHRYLSPALVQEVKAKGFCVFCYTVNTTERARELLAWGVDAFCTDRLDLIGPEFGQDQVAG